MGTVSNPSDMANGVNTQHRYILMRCTSQRSSLHNEMHKSKVKPL